MFNVFSFFLMKTYLTLCKDCKIFKWSVKERLFCWCHKKISNINVNRFVCYEWVSIIWEMVRKPSLNASKRKTYINWIKKMRISHIKAIHNKCVSYSISNLRSFGWMYWVHSSLLYFCALYYISNVITLQSLLMVIYVLKLPCRYCHLFSFFGYGFSSNSFGFRMRLNVQVKCETAIKSSTTQNAIKCSSERFALLNMDFMDNRLGSFYALNGERFIALFC